MSLRKTKSLVILTNKSLQRIYTAVFFCIEKSTESGIINYAKDNIFECVGSSLTVNVTQENIIENLQSSSI